MKSGVELKGNHCIVSVQRAVRKEHGVNKQGMYLLNQNSTHSFMICAGHHIGWLPAQGSLLALWNTFVDFSDC